MCAYYAYYYVYYTYYYADSFPKQAQLVGVLEDIEGGGWCYGTFLVPRRGPPWPPVAPHGPPSPVFFLTDLSGDPGRPILVGIIFWGGRWGAARGLPSFPWPPVASRGLPWPLVASGAPWPPMALHIGYAIQDMRNMICDTRYAIHYMQYMICDTGYAIHNL